MTIYSNAEFRKAERLERIYMAMMEPERFEHLLEFEEDDYRRKLEQAYQSCFKELSPAVAINFIQKNIAGCETLYKAKRVLDDMTIVFGRFLDKNKSFQKALVVERMYNSYERLKSYADILHDDGNIAAAAEMEEKAMLVLEKAAKMDGVDKIVTGMNAKDFVLPEVLVSSDARILKEGFEDAEIEEEE